MNLQHFDAITLVLAFFLSTFARSEFKECSRIVFLEFLAHFIFYNSLNQYIANNYTIYLYYAAFQLIAINYILKVNSHYFIVFLLLLNACVNLFSFYSAFEFWELDIDNEFISIYEAYPIVVGIIIVLELMYLFLISRWFRVFSAKYGINGDYYINILFCICARLCNKGVL